MARQETLQNTWLMICGYHLLYFKYEIFHRAGAALINQACVGNRGSFDQINGLMGFLLKRIVLVCQDEDQLSYKTRLILSFCDPNANFFLFLLLNYIQVLSAVLRWTFYRCWSTRVATLMSRWCLVNILVRAEGAETVVIWLRHLDLVMTKLQPASSAAISIQDVPTLTSPVLTN